MKNLLWLASYPKSGNTWMRIFLANLQKGAIEPIDINMIGDCWAGERSLFDQFSGLESSLLTDSETLQIRHQVYKALNKTLNNLTLLKTHAPYLYNSEGEELFPVQASRGVIYLIRNPLDLAASLAHHNSSTLDEAISIMADETYALAANNAGRPKRLLFEPVSSWSQNITSWVNDCKFPLIVIRYENMIFQPFESFSRAAKFVELPEDPNQIKRAIAHSSFNLLQKQEQIKGFWERPTNMVPFFRKGKVGSWREELSPSQVERIIQDHGEVMRRFGYLTDEGKPIY